MADISKSRVLKPGTSIPASMEGCIVIVRTEWNVEIVDELEAGCVQTLRDAGCQDIRVITVPGAFEIPFAVKVYWEAERGKARSPLAFITLGCVLRGDTPHFEYICKAVTDGVLQLNLTIPVPVIFGILTVDHAAQAEERIGGRHGHKGKEAAISALKMIGFVHSINQ